MDKQLLNDLRRITPEEQMLLKGKKNIKKDIYMSPESNIVDAARLLDAGKLIQVRTHTRFVHFPKHTHNYIEVIYMCSGSTHHVIDGDDVILKEGEMLFLSRTAVQEIYPAAKDDIAVNFIILPEFFDSVLGMLGSDNNMLHEFIVECLIGKKQSVGYMHFKVSDILPIQNLVENLIWTIWNKQSNRRSINQVTMGLLFLQLMNYMDRVVVKSEDDHQTLEIEVLSYIEQNYRDGELSELAKKLNYNMFWLSKEIKKVMGKNFKELVQEKRLSQATYLLKNTKTTVMDIGLAVGYENISYFHRIFFARFHMTPRQYRLGMVEEKAE